MESIKNQLELYLARKFPDRSDLKVKDFQEIISGWESEMYSCELSYESLHGQHQEKLVLRIYPGDDAYEKSANEYFNMLKLHEAGYPVPHVKLLERDASPFERPFVLMEYIDGKNLWRVLDKAPVKKGRELLSQFCELFVRLHNLDWRSFSNSQDTIHQGGGDVSIDSWLSTAGEMIQRYHRHELSPYLSWMREHRHTVKRQRTAVVHYDFHPSNILLRIDGSMVVVDWTGLQVTDARFDLAWTLLLAHMYAGDRVSDQILNEYEGHSGDRVQGMGIFIVAAILRRLFTVIVSIEQGAEQMGMRPGAEQLMQEQSEALGIAYEILVGQTGIRSDELERMIR